MQHVPAELSSFVGRIDELTAIGEAVHAGQVLTLVGPGGCGKTRLAIRVCHDQAARWPAGVWWVGLEDELDESAMYRRIAEVLDVAVPIGTDPISAITESLRAREVLLVLDNCEHLIEPVASAVQAIRAMCPKIAIVVTSRVGLSVNGERIWRVQPLELDDALDLFLQRVDAAGAGSAPSSRTVGRRICDRLDRLPLALELAAGWAGTLSLEQIADSLSEPYRLLGEGARTAPFRQQSLEASMAWSHELLDDDEAVLFRRLGVFEPGFAAAAVDNLGGDGLPGERALPALRGLVEKSLLVTDTTGGIARYRMLGVVREYARARLDESGEAGLMHDRHLDLQLAHMHELAPLLETDKDAWRTAVRPEYANIRAAIDWGLAQEDSTRGRTLAAAVVWLWQLDGRGKEGLRLLRLAAELGRDERTALQAEVLLALALVAAEVVPGGEPFAIAREAAELAAATGADATGRLARSLAAVGLLGTDLEAARYEAIDVRDDAARAGDGFATDASSALVGLTYLLTDDHVVAVEHLEPAVEGLRGRGDRDVASSGMSWLASAYMHLGDLRQAAVWAERAVATAEPLRDFHRISIARGVLAEVRTWEGKLDAAAEALDPLERLMASPSPPFAPDWRRARGLLAIAQGAPTDAIEWCQRAEPSWAGDVTPDAHLALAAAYRESGDAGLAAAAVDELLAEAATKAAPRIHAGALYERARSLGEADPQRALDLHHEALRIRSEHRLVLGSIVSLEAIAETLLRREAQEAAGVLAGAAARARADAGAHGLEPGWPDEATFMAAMNKGRNLEIDEAVEYATRARGPRRRPETGWDSLTPTERSVVELAVAGLSNPEIAARLFMSRGTVKTHLAHVYPKLGVANRTELARYIANERARRPAEA